VEKGNLKTQVEIAERNELGALADHFNQMTVSIRNYSEHLEEMVESRTAELKSTQAQLVEQEKLASLGSLTAGIAHEIKNPLNFVNNFAEVGAELAEELDDALTKGNMEEAKSILREITENATQIAKHGRRADSIVKSMMQHARGGTSVPENVDLNAFLGEYIDLAWHGRRARDPEFQTEVVRRFDKSMGNVHIQPQEMGRVILNLLNNAFDALKGTEGARITVTTRRGERAVEITVEDNGPGIPADVRERIFEPFFTTKASGEGTGLGLSLSYDIVTNGHGGTMSVGTSPDGGAQFSISLPG
jgi:C4-dicarboxylate-specific signal transduction histidine kinase